MEAIVNAFGIPRERLLVPVVIRGSWWLTMTDYHGRVVSIFDSAYDMFQVISASWKDQAIFRKRDIATQLKIEQFGLKTRIDATNYYAAHSELWWCEYAKCEIQEDGVRFVPTQPWDTFALDLGLAEFAWRAANRIEVHGRRIPSSPDHLFLRVSAFRQDPRTWQMEAAGQRDLVGQQVLREMPLLDEFTLTDSEELLQTLNLGWGLRSTLHPFLKSQPQAHWKVEVHGCAIQIDLACDERTRGAVLCGPTKRFVLQLMWRDGQGHEDVAPCRQCDIERLADEIREMVLSPLPSWWSEEDVLPFEPGPDS